MCHFLVMTVIVGILINDMYCAYIGLALVLAVATSVQWREDRGRVEGWKVKREGRRREKGWRESK